MPKNKKPVPRKSAKKAAEIDPEMLSTQLAALALEVYERELDEIDDADESDPAPDIVLDLDTLSPQAIELDKLIRNALRKGNDEVLYGAIDQARFMDAGAWMLLREMVQDAAGTALIRREGAPALEVNAFAIPIFVHGQGGLQVAHDFADPDAFDQLVASFKQAGLESPDAKVVLISHAYDIDEMDNITYSQLHDMVRDAAGSMTEKKLVARPALERSLSGWADNTAAPDQHTAELRFLVGFALKQEDDPYYQAPEDEAAMDDFFERRMERYRAWTEQAGPLVARCVAADPASVAVNFLYQDLFFNAKEQGLAELATLHMMAEMNEALERGGARAADVHAMIGPADEDDEMVLRTNLFDVSGALLGSWDKPLDLSSDMTAEVDDLHDALQTLGLTAISVCRSFDAQGQAIDPLPYE